MSDTESSEQLPDDVVIQMTSIIKKFNEALEEDRGTKTVGALIKGEDPDTGKNGIIFVKDDNRERVAHVMDAFSTWTAIWDEEDQVPVQVPGIIIIFDDKSPLRSGKKELILALNSPTGMLKAILHNILPADQGHMIYDLIGTLRDQNIEQGKDPAVLEAVATELDLENSDGHISMMVMESWDDMHGEEEYRFGKLGEDPDTGTQ